MRGDCLVHLAIAANAIKIMQQSCLYKVPTSSTSTYDRHTYMWRRPFIGACLSPLCLKIFSCLYTTRKGTRSWGRRSNSLTQLHDFSLLNRLGRSQRERKNKSVFKNRIAARRGCWRTNYIFHELDDKVGVPLFPMWEVFLFSSYYIGGKLAVCLHPRSKSWREDTNRCFCVPEDTKQEEGTQ